MRMHYPHTPKVDAGAQISGDATDLRPEKQAMPSSDHLSQVTRDSRKLG
jgi:hypothetical protein